LDEATGTVAADIVGNNSGIYVNGPEAALGQVGGSLQFHGAGDFVGAPGRDLWAFGANDFTVEVWDNFDRPVGSNIIHAAAFGRLLIHGH